jgi:hypothetical protein
VVYKYDLILGGGGTYNITYNQKGYNGRLILGITDSWRLLAEYTWYYPHRHDGPETYREFTMGLMSEHRFWKYRRFGFFALFGPETWFGKTTKPETFQWYAFDLGLAQHYQWGIFSFFIEQRMIINVPLLAVTGGMNINLSAIVTRAKKRYDLDLEKTEKSDQ